jgi:16S rRNA (cytidine1402-2'-O)-methyltransferase
MLYLVSTPIGNLGDMTHRAVEVLRTVDVVLAEDTRRTGVLLKHYQIEGRKLVSVHEHNEASRAGTVVDMLREGKTVALVSDAGTPLLSDPGARIARAAIEAGYEVVPVPGASALLAALVVSGLPADRFTFFGFVPRKGGGRTELLREVAALSHTAVLYESPHRVGELIRDLSAEAGPKRRVAIARELTKLHEEVFRGTLSEAEARIGDTSLRGEVVVVVEGHPSRAENSAEAVEEAARVLAEALLEQGVAPSAVARELTGRLDIGRNDAYQLVQQLRVRNGGGTDTR